MANFTPDQKGRGGRRAHDRDNHWYGDPVIGRIFRGVFCQPLTGASRTVEIVRFQGADIWKARIVETQSILVRLGLQVEFASQAAACSDVTEFLQRQGMRLMEHWQAFAPEWRGAEFPPPPPRRRSGLGGLVQ